MMRRVLGFPRFACVPGLDRGALAALSVFLVIPSGMLLAETYEVQRTRGAMAEVVRDGGDWVITIEFSASRSLGSAKDAEVNRSLARDYALRGLFLELKGERETDIVVSGLQTESSEEVDGYWKARFRTPANGIVMRPRQCSAPDAEPATNQASIVPLSIEAPILPPMPVVEASVLPPMPVIETPTVPIPPALEMPAATSSFEEAP